MTNPTKTELVARCVAIGAQRATFDDFSATNSATPNATNSLKALAGAVLVRNTKRNTSATEAEKQRNFCNEKSNKKLRSVAPELQSKSNASLSHQDKAAILRWLTWINENNQEIIDDVLTHCATDSEGLAYYLKRAEEEPNDDNQSSSKLVSCGACAHFDSNHSHGGGSGICKAGVMPSGACHWSDTLRHCKDFKNGR